MSALPGTPSRTTVVILLGVLLLPCLLNLGTPPLWDANEPLYAQPPKEALEWATGDVLAPTWNGKPYFAHPPLSTWITIPFYAVFGSTEFGHRLPMALAAFLIVIATYRLARPLAGRRVALFAALLLCATPRFWLFSRQLSGDVYLVLFLMWAWVLALPVVAGTSPSRRRLRAANILVGLGFTAKGPIILVLYSGVLFFTWLLARPRATWALLRPWRGVLLIVLLGAPWFVYMSVRYEDLDFFGKHFGHYTFGRVAGSIGERTWLFYPRILLGDAQPWITVLPFSAYMAWRMQDRRAEAWIAWVGMLWILLVFSLSLGKRNVYLLPLYPLLCIGVAPLADAVWRGAYRPGVRLAGLGAAVGCFGGAAMLWLLARNEPRLFPEIGWPIGILALMGAPLFVAGWKGRGRWVAAGALATLILVQIAVVLTFPALARFRPVPDMAARIRAEQSVEAPEPAIIYRAAIHSLNFYLDRPTKVAASARDLLQKMSPAREAFVLVPEHRFDVPGKVSGGSRVGLKNELPEASFDILETRPLLIFKFRYSILGQDKTTRDLLLVRVRLQDDPATILARMGPEDAR